MESALAKDTMIMVRKKVEKAFRAVQKATAVLAKSPSGRHLRENFDAAMREHTLANTAWMAAITVSNELLLHQVTESDTQTDDIGITGS
jgi:uncharacterized membrane protein YgaE (UPF0421/DUF939 family)